LTRLQFIFFALKSCQHSTILDHFLQSRIRLKSCHGDTTLVHFFALKSCLRGMTYPFSKKKSYTCLVKNEKDCTWLVLLLT